MRKGKLVIKILDINEDVKNLHDNSFWAETYLIDSSLP